MPVVVIVAVAVRPVRIPAPIGVIGPTPVEVPAPIAAPVGTVAPTIIVGRIVVPIERVVAVGVNVVGVTAGVVVVIIAYRRGGSRAKTLDASCIIGVVIGLGGGIHYTVGVGHRLRGLVHGICVVDVILAVGIIGLVVVFRVTADAWADVGAVAGGHASALVAVRRVVDVVFGHLLVRRAGDEGKQGDERYDPERFHCIVFLFVV